MWQQLAETSGDGDGDLRMVRGDQRCDTGEAVGTVFLGKFYNTEWLGVYLNGVERLMVSHYYNTI